MSRRRLGPRASIRLALTFVFACAILVTAMMAGATSVRRGAHHFSHVYPPNPRSFERPKVTNPVPRAAHDRTVRASVRFTSLAALAYVLPRGTLVRAGRGTWRLTAPVDLTRHAMLVLNRGTLELAPGSFLQARAGGVIELRHMTVTSTAGKATATRGFLVARDGGRLVLRDDVIRNLGHLGALAYGVSFRSPAAGSAVIGSSLDGNYFGVFLSHAAGVSIVANTVTRSAVYGIDPYGGSHDDLIARNVVSHSGLHGIVLARGVSRIRVVGNRVVHAGAHGIVLFAGARRNTVEGNTVAHTFDGIVITSSSGNRLVRNTITAVARFGIRVSGASGRNTLVGNSISGALLGAYVYAGATHTTLVDNAFSNNRENVRVRRDAGPTVVRPKPARSELP